MVILIVAVVIAILKYQNRTRKHLLEVNDLKNTYHQEILKAQLEMQEQTFRTISQEIHDNIGQILSLIRLNISSIKTEEDSHSARKIITSKELLDQAIDDLRDLSKRLNTEYVSRQGLAESLRFQLNLIQKTGLFITTQEVHGEERALDPEKKLIIFRIAQEALNNIMKHADAKNISVLLMYLPDKIILSIKDDGKGFEPEQADKSLGLQNMRHRANLIGAKFTLQSKPGEGCLARLILPTA
ncbi:MAG: sensor histidine kinase [Adhaeribacter sp.]|nr:sensor histidine kinase [Adhaeribacter sp.]